jgi:predicted dehydrogenase
MNTFAIVGVGARSVMYTDLIFLVDEFSRHNRLLAMCDLNPGRLALKQSKLSKLGSIPCYAAQDFKKMLANHKPDYLIVCTMDSTHAEYICSALEAGCDVITEKPMTTDEILCQKIIDTVRTTGRQVRVNFNYRYSPVRSQFMQLLLDGVIGNVLSIEFKWMLDTRHGADYFRRWHRNKANSGGLIVHKATHHFDLVNWWIRSVPVEVSAYGKRGFYTREQAQRYGLSQHTERCLTCPEAVKCGFYLDIRKFPEMEELYLDNENFDGYFRDKCVFSDEINIEDSLNVIVRYDNGALMSYSLNAFSPYEGYHIAINGTKGRIEHTCRESSYVSSNGKVQGALTPEGANIIIYPHFEAPYDVQVPEAEGSHGGGDMIMLRSIFGKTAPPDPLHRSADYVQGAYSILIGIAANKSMKSGLPVCIGDLVTGLPANPFTSSPSQHARSSRHACKDLVRK